jgi:hypothetical protein
MGLDIRTQTTCLALVMLTVAGAVYSPVAAGVADVRHPFILWNKADLDRLRRDIKTDPLVKTGCDRLARLWAGRKTGLHNLMRYAIDGDEKAAAIEKKRLLQVVRSKAPRGGAQWLTVLRYDLLYDKLTPTEKAEVEKMFHFYIHNTVVENAVFNPKLYNPSRNYQRYDARKYTRTNWLPNITWPRKVSANLMAVALRDEKLIRETWAAYGSYKWYFDNYLSDVGFYHEEFGKMGSTPGAMLLYCLALERLGLDELGFGYKPKGGATMRGHIESLIHIGYPRVELHSPRPHYPIVTMGDSRSGGSSQKWNLPSPAFQHSMVMGYGPEGNGGSIRWVAHGAWGGEMRGNLPQWDGYSGFTPKMQIPLWFELAHKRWPNAGFAYFLAQMRPEGQKLYVPSPLFGLGPIDPDKTTPPAAPSTVWPERGFVMLRAEQGSDYWESPAPAVAMRLGANYAHNVRDSFALLGFYAMNRPIYINRHVTPGYASGWTRSVQSHAAVRVDKSEPAFTNEVTVRHDFRDPARFVSATSSKIYKGVELTRSLFLTREYLLDLTDLTSPQEHDYHWLVHALGQAEYDRPRTWRSAELPKTLDKLPDVRKYSPGKAGWSITALQTCAFADKSKARLPSAWYDRKIGVRLSMLGCDGTDVFTATTPLPLKKWRDKNKKTRLSEVPSEVGGVTFVVSRRAARTTFAALHEPFEGGAHLIDEFRTVGRSEGALVVKIVSKRTRLNDRAMVQFSGGRNKSVTLGDGRESFTFNGHAFVRIGGGKVRVTGGLKSMRLAVRGRPNLIVNGKPARANSKSGILSYGQAGK